MSTLKNQVQLIGHLGAKPEIRTFENDKKLASFSLATNESYRNQKGEKVDETQWHKLVAWGKVADIAEKYTDKGSEIAVSGKLVNKKYEDKEGVTKYVTEVLVNEILLMDSRS